MVAVGDEDGTEGYRPRVENLGVVGFRCPVCEVRHWQLCGCHWWLDRSTHTRTAACCECTVSRQDHQGRLQSADPAHTFVNHVLGTHRNDATPVVRVPAWFAWAKGTPWADGCGEHARTGACRCALSVPRRSLAHVPGACATPTSTTMWRYARGGVPDAHPMSKQGPAPHVSVCCDRCAHAAFLPLCCSAITSTCKTRTRGLGRRSLVRAQAAP